MLLKKDGIQKERKVQRCPKCGTTLHPENTEFGVRLVCSGCHYSEEVKK